MALVSLVVLSALFAVTHLGMSHEPIRARLVEKLGLWPFRGLYSVVSLATFGGAAVVFWRYRHLGPELWSAPGWFDLAVSVPLMFLALQFLVLTLGSPSPIGMLPAKAEPRAVLRITRHPMNMAFASFALAHLVANAHLGDAAFLASILFVGLVGAYHQDRRIAREKGEEFQKFRSQTSVFPFGAVVTRRTRFVADELSFPLVALGLLALLILFLFHGRLFGAGLV